MSNTEPEWFQEIDHTGDIGIRVTAETLPVLYERAAEGTFRVLTDLSAVRPDTEETIHVSGPDREALLVRWLSELNYRHTVDHVVYCDFQIDAIDRESEDLDLRATIRGEKIDPERHTVYTEIKAITFHGLEVKETEDGWTVQVIFDM